MTQHQTLLRIGIFYDGTYFSRVSNYYLYEHERKARIAIDGLNNFVRERVSELESVDKRFCQVVDAHYFRGRLSAKQAQEKASLYGERQFDDVLIREGVTMHYLPLKTDRATGGLGEKGIDVWFALEAYELAVLKRFDISVVVTGDGDFVPLVRKLNTLGTRVMLLGWDFEFQDTYGNHRQTRTSEALIREVTYPVMMDKVIDDRSQNKSTLVNELFIKSTRQIDAGPSTESRAGTIDNFNDDRGFGFIRPAEGGANLFFHVSSLSDELQNMETKDGLSVAFVGTEGDRGPIATDIELDN